MVYFVPSPKQNLNKMKKAQFILFVAAGLFFTACTTSETTTDEGTDEVTTIVYELDAKNSSLQWTGRHGDDSHTGTVSFSEGSIGMQDGALDGGSFVVDMTTIVEPDGQGLVGHLMGLDDNEYHKPADFFHTTKFPTVKVILGDYSDGILSAKLDILGQTLPINVEVEVMNDEDGASIIGTFTVNFEDLGIPGLQADPETGEGISPAIDFELNLALTSI